MSELTVAAWRADTYRDTQPTRGEPFDSPHLNVVTVPHHGYTRK